MAGLLLRVVLVPVIVAHLWWGSSVSPAWGAASVVASDTGDDVC